MDEQAKITHDMLGYIEQRPDRSQRSMANELGIAVGLVNAYIHRCVKKGLIKISQAPAGRYLYYLTPKGFAEKARLSAEFLSQSFKLINAARREYDDMLAQCRRAGHLRVLLAGASDLVEVAKMCADSHGVAIIGVIDSDFGDDTIAELPVRPNPQDLGDFDVAVLTDLRDPQRCFEILTDKLEGVRPILVPSLFTIAKENDA